MHKALDGFFVQLALIVSHHPASNYGLASQDIDGQCLIGYQSWFAEQFFIAIAAGIRAGGRPWSSKEAAAQRKNRAAFDGLVSVGWGF